DSVKVTSGPTGSGKSTFIRQVTGDQRCKVGKSLESETLEVHEYRCQYKERTYVLIDTPGFDDSYRSNDEIVKTILVWLEESYRSRKLLSGIIYLHRISDPRMQGSSLENIRMFRRLCGFEALKNVLLVTTFWDTVSDAEGRRRERELSSNDEFWGRMIKKGSKVKRWSQCSRSDVTKGILDAIVPDAKRALQAQIEIVDQGKQWEKTDVG
ncbi:P-loop containing nucleoside triphosphate hydrolase protein, partial [Phaeosphaeriaceae sp. PMI808]